MKILSSRMFAAIVLAALAFGLAGLGLWMLRILLLSPH